VGSTVSFLAAIVNTMQNWRDMLQRAAPGSRERVFTVCHTKEEGGLNLDMKAQAIKAMAQSGELAADEIVAAFQPPATTPAANDDWHYHRWVRLRLLLPLMRDFLAKLEPRFNASVPQPSIKEFLNRRPAPMGRSYELSSASGTDAYALLDALAKASRAVPNRSDFERTAPRPPGTLRVTPTF
jgi:hypothetical protein